MAAGSTQAAVQDAVELLRKTLAAESDGAVTMIQVGFSTNLARLLESAPDRYSDLSGMELVKKKVRLLTVMAGNFAEAKREYNVMIDIPAATKLFATWPTDIYISGFEVGAAILYPAVSIENDFPKDNPVAEAYRLYAKMPYDRPSWDLTTVLYDLRPDRGYFGVSQPGDVLVSADGTTSFSTQPARQAVPAKGGSDTGCKSSRSLRMALVAAYSRSTIIVFGENRMVFCHTGNKCWVPHSPGFPVKFVGVDELHAAFLNESRTCRRCLVPRTGNPGQAVFRLEWDNGSRSVTHRPKKIRTWDSSLGKTSLPFVLQHALF